MSGDALVVVDEVSGVGQLPVENLNPNPLNEI
jgi:hypothetical protein